MHILSASFNLLTAFHNSNFCSSRYNFAYETRRQSVRPIASRIAHRRNVILDGSTEKSMRRACPPPFKIVNKADIGGYVLQSINVGVKDRTDMQNSLS